MFIKDKKIHSKLLEINISEHCNLKCKGCSHLSPITKSKFIDKNSLQKNLIILQEHYHTEKLKLLGGEPLLNPDLINIIKELKANTNIFDEISIVTNGILIDKISKSLLLKILQEIDILELTYYEDAPFNIKYLKKFIKDNNHLKCKVEISFSKNFRESYANKGTSDKTLIQKIYSTCLITHCWECHSIQDNYFYKCPQCNILAKHKKINDDNSIGVKILNNKNIFKNLKEYLQNTKPLKTCKYCLGAVGKLYKHQQIKDIKKWEKHQNYTSEELLDFDFLKKLEKSKNMCLENNFCLKKQEFIKSDKF